MKAAALSLVLALSLSATAFAQQEARNEREYRNDYTDLTVGLRNSIPTGEALSGVRWGDLVSGGVGVDLQYSELWRVSSWVYAGWYGGLAVDSFGGHTSTQTDAATGTSITIRTKRLDMADAEFGGRLRQNFNGFHLDENIGVGAVYYMKEKLDERNGGPTGLEFIKSSINYMVDAGIRIGAPIGKDVELSLGIAYQLNGAPDAGKDFSTLNFRPMQNLSFGLALDFGF